MVKTRSIYLMAALAFGAATASRAAEGPQNPQADTVLLYEAVDGNYLVRRYRVDQKQQADYSVLYQINAARLRPTLGSNARELGELNDLVQSLMKESPDQVRKIVITGYASPDGPLKFNEKLAASRAADFVAYADKNYGLENRFGVESRSVAEDWETCRMMVENSSMPDKAAVLAVIDSRDAPDHKEYRLKQMPAAWEYMKTRILPSLRRVEVLVTYNRDLAFEQRIMIPVETIVEVVEPPCDPCCDYMVDEGITGIIVRMPEW